MSGVFVLTNDKVSSISYFGKDGRDWIPFVFLTDSDIARKIAAGCEDKTQCVCDGSVRALNKKPEKASAAYEVISVTNCSMPQSPKIAENINGENYRKPIISEKQNSQESNETDRKIKADAEEEARGDAQEANSISSPDIQVGDVYVVESIYPDNPKSNNVTERKVVSSDGKKITMLTKNINSNKGKARTLVFTPEWNLISTRSPDGNGTDYTPPLKYFEFPLYPRKQWK